MINVKRGLEILLQYEPTSTDFAAEHDVIYASATPPESISPEHIQELDDLGWYWSKESECWSKFV